MLKSSLFIAVQCCNCSTMQVKQQKKSSNKWVCVVCNQKQSVKKLYAQGYQAKEIRHFVQSFNMGRKFADEQTLIDGDSSLGHFVEHLEGGCGEEEIKVKRRTDWSEYIEDDENKDPGYLRTKSNGEEFEPEIMTEFPDEGMFKKPRLTRSYDSSSCFGSDAKKVYKLQFSKRNSTKERSCSQQATRKEATKTQPILSTVEPVWVEASANNNLTRNVWQQEQEQERHISRGAFKSKWSEYMEECEGDDSCFQREIEAFADDLKLMNHYNLAADGTDQRVEEDVHPDFL